MNASYQTITLAPGESRSFHSRGKVFACDSATDNFGVRFDDQSELTASSKRIFGSPQSPEFRRFTIHNTSGAANTIVFAVSYQSIVIEQQVASITASITASGKNAPTYSKGTAGVLPATGVGVVFTGLDGTKSRKAFSIFNRETAASGLNIRVAAKNFGAGHHIDGRQGYVMECGDQITLYGVDGAGADAAVSYNIFEVFYS